MKRIIGIIIILVALSFFAGSVSFAQKLIWGTKSENEVENPKQNTSNGQNNTKKSTICIRPNGKSCKIKVALPIGSQCCCDTKDGNNGRDCTGRITY